MISPASLSLSLLLTIIRVHGNLTPISSPASLSLSLSAVDHHVGSRKSNLYDITSFPLSLSLSAVDHHEGSRKSNPYDITSSSFSLSADDHHVGSRKSNLYDITSCSLSLSLLLTIMRVHGNLTYIISPAALSLSLCC